MKIYLLMGEWTDEKGNVGSSIIHHAYKNKAKADRECDRRNGNNSSEQGGKFVYYVTSVPFEEL